jgi:hypothetical protein
VRRCWLGLWRRFDRALFDELHAPDFADRYAAGRGRIAERWGEWDEAGLNAQLEPLTDQT